MKLTIAFLQLLPTGSLKGNMEKGIKACFQAKEKGADIAIFPEMWSCGYAFPHEEASLRECAIPRYGSFVKRFAELAAEAFCSCNNLDTKFLSSQPEDCGFSKDYL